MNARQEGALAQEDLAYIRRVLDATRDATRLSGSHYLLWGTLIGAGLLLTWLLLERWLPWPPAAIAWVWGVLTVLGWVGSGWLLRREHVRAPAIGHAARQMGLVWAGFGITAPLLYFAGSVFGPVPPQALSGLMALCMGLAVWAVGLIAGIGWFRNLALAWWLGGALLLAWPGQHGVLVLAAMMLLLFALPGWWLGRGGRE
jgi:hypothetical protein